MVPSQQQPDRPMADGSSDPCAPPAKPPARPTDAARSSPPSVASLKRKASAEIRPPKQDPPPPPAPPSPSSSPSSSHPAPPPPLSKAPIAAATTTAPLPSDAQSDAESDLTEMEQSDMEDLLVMSPEKRAAAAGGVPGQHTGGTGPATEAKAKARKPRKRAPLTAEQQQAKEAEKAQRERARAEREKQKEDRQKEREAKAAQRAAEESAKAADRAAREAERERKKADEDALRQAKRAEDDRLKASRAAARAEDERVKSERKALRERERAQADALKAAKRAAREREKAELKEREEEKIRKEAAVQKSFLGFFKKGDEKGVAGKKRAELKTVQLSDFERTFLPFETKKGASLAPINRFRAERERLAAQGIAVDAPEPADLSEAALLQSFLATVPGSRIPTRPTLPPGVKCAPPRSSVRAVFARASEAELTGVGDARAILKELEDGRWFWRKRLQFREDTRPAYNGTWTQSSSVVGPRTPFGKDTALFDYAYDSGEEWEAPSDDGGEDLDAESLAGSPRRKGARDEPGEQGRSLWDTDSEDGDFASGSDDDESDSEAEGFVVDSDDEADDADAAATTPAQRSASPTKSLSVPAVAATAAASDAAADADSEVELVSVKKRKRRTKHRSSGKDKDASLRRKKRKELNVLVPVVKGPLFEQELGTCAWDGFEVFRLQLLNDTPVGIDPFSYTALPPQLTPEVPDIASALPKQVSGTMPPPTLPSSAAGPSNAAASSSSNPFGVRKPYAPKKGSSASSNLSSVAAGKKPSASSSGPDKRLPLAHLPEFLQRVARSTRNQVLLLAELQEHFKPLGVSKAAVSAELKMRARRLGKADGSPWAVEPGAWAEAGLPVPPDAQPFPPPAAPSTKPSSTTQTKLSLPSAPASAPPKPPPAAASGGPTPMDVDPAP